MANTAAPTALEVGKKYLFKGYAEANEAPTFQPGEIVIVYDATDKPEENGYNVKSEDGERTDTLFADEVETYAEPPAAKEKAPKANGKGSKAAKAAPAPAPEPETTNAEEGEEQEQENDPPATEPEKPAGKRAEKKTERAKAVKDAEKEETKAVTVAKPKGKEMVYESVETALTEGALEAAKHLRQAAEESYFTLGGVLFEIFTQELFKAVGFATFEAYVEGALDMSRRRARDLMEIYEKAKLMRLSEDDLRRIGYTKVRTILQKVPAEKLGHDFKKWSKAAEKSTREQLTQAIETEYVTAPGEKVTKTTFRFVVMGDQGDMVKDVLEEVKAKSPTGAENTSDSDAFVQLVTEYSSLAGTANVTIEDDILRLVARYGADVVQNAVAEHFQAEEAEQAPVATAGKGRKRSK